MPETVDRIVAALPPGDRPGSNRAEDTHNVCVVLTAIEVAGLRVTDRGPVHPQLHHFSGYEIHCITCGADWAEDSDAEGFPVFKSEAEALELAVQSWEFTRHPDGTLECSGCCRERKVKECAARGHDFGEWGEPITTGSRLRDCRSCEMSQLMLPDGTIPSEGWNV